MTSDEIKQQLADGQVQFQQINETLQKMNNSLASMKSDMRTTKEIVEAWNAVKTGGKFIRWAVPIVTGIGSFWIMLKGWIFR